MRILRPLLAVLLLLCLPLQGLAAVAMPLGMAHEAAAVQPPAEQVHATDHCLQHEHHARLQQDTQPQQLHDPCDRCFSCHIGIAMALSPFVAGFTLIPSRAALPALGVEKPAILTFPFFRPPIFA